MTQAKKKFKKIFVAFVALLIMSSLVSGAVFPVFGWGADSLKTPSHTVKGISTRNDLRFDMEDYYDPSVVSALSDTIADDEEISVIVQSNTVGTVLDAYQPSAASSVSAFLSTRAGKKATEAIDDTLAALRARISNAGIKYELGSRYGVLLSGFEVIIRAGDFGKLSSAVGSSATLIVGEEYEKCETKIVENDVNVYDTGIFNASDSKYDGSGTVVAVLDTGLDYTHSAFDVNRFEGTEVLTVSSVAQKIADTTAASFTANLSAEDVYINKKVPYAYDYADRDADVYPIESEHGTHVSGIIVGNDDTITGVAPNAQLVSMKVFSDTQQGARTSWILAALEDCVLLEVDVINMSLGTSCGFSREVDEENVNKVYDAIAERGISLVTAASNDYNATYGSEKNGNLGLTSNPSSGTVGSPSTYGAALSVASVSGVKTPYLLYGGTIMYFTEASGLGGKQKNFVNELLGNETEKSFEYITIPGVGRSVDYTGIDVTGKIALVRRGSNTFEEKARVAIEKGAVACIIYNNVSGDISMSVASVQSPVCSLSQNNGEILAADKKGVIKISKTQTAGPFMSNFSSWGPTEDLRIKPEITAHGGDILSAVPGQSYDRLSGTSMAAPNQAGVTALFRQYVKETFPSLTPTEVTARVNQIMMSTADIVYNKNGLPYAVRKQGAGLANLTKATSSKAFISTYDENGTVMNKAKLELGDDPDKAGKYVMKFAVNNTSASTLTYNVGAIVQTEGVSETLTHRGDTTVTEEGYLLHPTLTVDGIVDGTAGGTTIKVDGGKTAVVTITVTLSEADKKYLDASFKNGMYVEGFITLDAAGNEVDLNVPLLAFYGNWLQAPLFDLDYFETSKDELDDAIDTLDKTLPDAYATRPIGGLYNDYIAYLGSYAYIQDPASTRKISAERDRIALSNQSTGSEGTGVHSISSVWAGMLRNAKSVDITITDAVTGESIFSKSEYNVRKSYNYGGAIRSSSIDVDFDVADYDLKNNARYMVTLKGNLDYGDGGKTANLKNTFSFPFTVDFQAPAVTDCRFYTEYDSSAKKMRLYADIDIYDNHYTQGAVVGYVYNVTDPASTAKYGLKGFDRYVQPVDARRNSTYTLTYELTDKLDEIKQKSYNGNSFVVQVMDYAQNTATYEIAIPDSIKTIAFADEAGELIDGVTLSPNETYAINAVVTPAQSWGESLNYASNNPDVVRVVGGKLLAVGPGETTVTATSNADAAITRDLPVKVLSETEEGYVRYDKPVADSFALTQYTVDKAFYFLSSEDREIGQTGNVVQFTNNRYALSMFPSEAVTVEYKLAAYYPDEVSVEYLSNNPGIVTVDENGKITAVAEGSSSVTVRVLMNGESTYYSQTINITVKNPYETNAMYLMRYTGLGGEVRIPADLGITEIQQYAFIGYEYVAKDENDVINDEDPLATKPVPLEEETTITKVVIPEGVETIDAYAFANLKELEEVVLPSTLTKINGNAFSGCTKLSKINLEHVKFMNQYAFAGCALQSVSLDSIIAIGIGAFTANPLKTLVLPESAQSIGANAFSRNAELTSVIIKAAKVKLGDYAFAACTQLQSIDINASVIPEGVFTACAKLANVTLGQDVTVIGAGAFAGTAVGKFTVKPDNVAGITTAENGQCLLTENGTNLLLVAPTVKAFSPWNNILRVGDNAFAGNTVLTTVKLSSATSIGANAFMGCSALKTTTFGTLTSIGDYAFAGCTSLNTAPSFAGVKKIGNYAFYTTALKTVSVASGTEVGDYAFAGCALLQSVVIGDGVVLGDGAFAASMKQAYGEPVASQQTSSGTLYLVLRICQFNTSLTSLTIGKNAVIGEQAFAGNASLARVVLGAGAAIGDYAFYNNASLADIELGSAVSVGAFAFSGTPQRTYLTYDFKNYIEEGRIAGAYSSALVSVDLSSCEALGVGAFMYSEKLTTVTLGNQVTVVPALAFDNCIALQSINLNNTDAIGTQAFFGCTALSSVDLTSVTAVYPAAFALTTSLQSVKLNPDGVEIGAQAFYGAQKLSEIDLRSALFIGASAFEKTAIARADLRDAEYVGAQAFMDSAVTEVVLGENLQELGDNPFADCEIGEFTDENGDTTFDVSKTVKVVDGVLYATMPNGGMALVSYPQLKQNKTMLFEAAANTVRIAQYAFANSSVQAVRLPLSLKAIGDKAFFGCKSLLMVEFRSLEAPILEEAYDESYQTFENFAFTGEMTIGEKQYKGLGIVPFYMWNVTGENTNYYYGANFVNYIGKEKQPLIMVRPVNGTGYDTFIYGQYFKAVADGAASPTEETLLVISLIDALPDAQDVTLDDEAQIVAARVRYDGLDRTQQSLVTNLSRLENAEEMLRNILPKPEPKPEPKQSNGKTTAIIVLSVLLGVFVLATAAGAVVLLLVWKKKLTLGKSKSEKKPEPSEEAQENRQVAAQEREMMREDPMPEAPADENEKEETVPAAAEQKASTKKKTAKSAKKNEDKA